MPRKLIPPELETIAKYCEETGADADSVHREVLEFGEKVLGWPKNFKNIDGAAYLWVQRQGKEPPPRLDAPERCFFEASHWGDAEIHENPDGSVVVLCKRHKMYLCGGKSHSPSGVWVIGDHGFSTKSAKSPGFQWFWFCEEHKPPKREELKERAVALKAPPYTPHGWKWDSQRRVLLKA